MAKNSPFLGFGSRSKEISDHRSYSIPCPFQHRTSITINFDAHLYKKNFAAVWLWIYASIKVSFWIRSPFLSFDKFDFAKYFLHFISSNDHSSLYSSEQNFSKAYNTTTVSRWIIETSVSSWNIYFINASNISCRATLVRWVVQHS